MLQVRCMAAVLLLVGQGLEAPGIIAELLDWAEHLRAAIRAPARGAARRCAGRRAQNLAKPSKA